jgi:hypothetical protein
MVKGKRITKKKLKEPDEFITLTQRSLLFIETHAKKVVTAGVVLLVIVLGIVFYEMWDRKKETDAGQKLSHGGVPESEFSVPGGISLRV